MRPGGPDGGYIDEQTSIAQHQEFMKDKTGIEVTTSRIRTVLVKELPSDLGAQQALSFVREMERSMDMDRPSIVLDCSRLRQMDRQVIHLLLCCLEEAMKRNGDIKLAAVPADTREAFQAVGASRLFDIHETAAEAVRSYRQYAPHAAAPASEIAITQQETESAE